MAVLQAVAVRTATSPITVRSGPGPIHSVLTPIFFRTGDFQFSELLSSKRWT